MAFRAKDYPPEWKTEIRPRILARARNRCELCGIKNHIIVLRGEWCGREVYQDEDGWIYDANTSDKIGGDYVGEVDITGKRKFTRVVLTIAHWDNPDKMDCRDENLKAACQRCHLLRDLPHHMNNARLTREKKAGLQRLF